MLPRPPYYIEGRSVDDLPDGVYGDFDAVMQRDAGWEKATGQSAWDYICEQVARGDELKLKNIITYTPAPAAPELLEGEDGDDDESGTDE